LEVKVEVEGGERMRANVWVGYSCERKGNRNWKNMLRLLIGR
jgi:hypothetical protein